MRLKRITRTPAEDIAHACIYIARANHYMVGLVAEGLSFDDLSDAKGILVGLENNDPTLEDPKNVRQAHVYNRAFMVLADYCRRVHHCDC